MRVEMPETDWHMKLADAIDNAKPGDVIVCHSEDMKRLGERAKNRMCPDKEIVFEVES